MLKSVVFLLYAALAYVLALATILYFVGFIAGVGVPKAINDGTPVPVWVAIFIDIGLIALFGWHHSGTARHRFKARWTRVVSPTIERATYLVMTAFLSTVLIGLWQPIPITLWEIDFLPGVIAIRTAFALMFAVMVLSTFQLGHFRFFGLAQAWQRVTGQIPQSGSLYTRWFYGLVRHPISLGWILLPWLVPHVTVGQALFGVGIAVYVLVATPSEEADLESDLGDAYRTYRNQVPAFLPALGRLTPTVYPPNDDLP